MSQSIDIYNCPARVGNSFPIPYMIAVMQAAFEGKPVQTVNEGENWETMVSEPLWAWHECDYRIDPASKPKDKLEFKVGDWVYGMEPGVLGIMYKIGGIVGEKGDRLLFDGQSGSYLASYFRLATTTEIIKHLGTQLKHQNAPTITDTNALWVDAEARGYVLWRKGRIQGASEDDVKTIEGRGLWLPGQGASDYAPNSFMGQRIKQNKPFIYLYWQNGTSVPIEQFDLIPKTKRPLLASEYPAGSLWVRSVKPYSMANWTAFLIVNIKDDGGLGLIDAAGKWSLWYPTKVAETLEYSPDRKTWKPCYIEV